jgi:glycosyltransferase involved in cell wall biosynthesis
MVSPVMLTVAHIIKITRVAGAENHLLTLISGLRTCPLNVHVVVLVEPDQPMDEFVRAAAPTPVHRVIIRHDLDVSVLPKIRRLLKQIRPDVVHTHLLHADLYGIPAARIAGVPAIITSRHNDNAFRKRAPLRLVNSALWHMADAGIAISDSIARFVVEVEGAPAGKIYTIPYSLSYTPMSPSEQQEHLEVAMRTLEVEPDTLLVGMVCRLVEQKGVIYGLQAFCKVTERFPNASLVIVGDGPLRDTLEATLMPLNLQKRVRFLGWREDAAQLMARFDLLLVPSLWEGFGLVILEAMAQAVPTIASRVSAIPEIVVDGETGLLVPPRDVDALTDALVMLLSDHALRRHMGMMAQARLEEHFTAKHMIEQTAALYHQLAGK